MLIFLSGLIKLDIISLKSPTKPKYAVQNTVMLIIDNIPLLMLLKHVKRFYSTQNSNKIFKKAHTVLCSLILGDDLCSREITVADGRLKLGCFRKDFLFSGQLQSFTRVRACVLVFMHARVHVRDCLRAYRLMLKLLCGLILQLLSLL